MKQKYKILILFFLIPVLIMCCTIIFKGLFILILPLLIEIQPILMLLYWIRLKNKRKKAKEETDKLIKENYKKVYTKNKFYPENEYTQEELDEIFYDNTYLSIESFRNNTYGILVYTSYKTEDGLILKYINNEGEEEYFIDDFNNVYYMENYYDEIDEDNEDILCIISKEIKEKIIEINKGLY